VLSRFVEQGQGRQLVLFEEGGVESERDRKLARVSVNVGAKLGRDGVMPATLLRGAREADECCGR
jgi:hypothetical protein